jgi:thiol-disulfide isomerase/thioredoxin
MSRRAAHGQAPVRARAGRPVETRRSREQARRAKQRRVRLGAYLGAAVVVLGAVIAAVVAASSKGSGISGSGAARVGALAPNGAFTTLTGATEDVASLRGQPALLWFVTTWCSSCQAGTQAMAQAIDAFDAYHVRVVEIENANDLGQAGPSIATFGQQLAGPSFHNPDWTWGVASSSLTRAYNPAGDLDIYYLLDSRGRIVYINSSPGATMNQLLAEAARVARSARSSASSAAAAATASEVPMPASVAKAVTSVPPSVAAAVGLPASVAAPKVLHGQPPLTIAGKPAVIYVGAEYCPYCAAERWAAVVALSRFGTFSHLGETHSSHSDVFPGTPTFSFYGSSYSSRYLAFDPTETNTNQPAPGGGGYGVLQPLTGLAKTTFDTYDAPPFVPQANAGAIPFYDVGNRLLVSGASYSPQVLEGLDVDQIAADLSNPASPVTQDIVGAANYLTAGICAVTGGRPASVCQEPYVTAAARSLGLP